MHNVSLRPTRPGEQLQIRRLIAKNNLNPFGLIWDNFIVAADQQDTLIGCGQIKSHGELEELASLIVVDEWQGRGVSTRLMEALLEKGTRPLWLMCESTLIPYYNRFGFREVDKPSELPAYFQNVFWGSRITFGLLFFFRRTYIAIMLRDN